MRQVFLRRTGRPRGLCEAAAAAAGRHWIASAFPFISLFADIARRPPPHAVRPDDIGRKLLYL